MPAGIPIPPPGFDQLTVDEQIRYIQSLWDHIAGNVDQVPLAEWQRAILDERLTAHKNAPHEARPWPEVIDRLQDRLRSTR